MNTNKFYIERLSIEDIEQVIELQKVCYKENLREGKEVFETLCSVFPEGSKKAVSQQMIGYICFHPYIYKKVKPLNQPLILKGNENCMHLHDVCIHPSYRGLGLLNLLMESFNKETKLMVYEYQTLVAVQRSENMWRKYGFNISEKVSYGKELAYYMTKSL